MLCTAVIFRTRSPEPSASKRAAQSRKWKPFSRLFTLPTPIPTLRVAGYFQTDELNMFRCRSRLARRIPVTRVFPHRDACVYMYMCTCPLTPRSFFFLSSHASTRRGDVSPVCQGPSMCSARGIRSLNMNSPYGTLICIWATMTNPPTLSLPLPPTKSTARVSRAKTPPQREF